MKIKYSTLLTSLLLPLTAISANTLPLTPPNAVAGECYARVLTPAKYENVEEKVLVKEATENITIVPAKYETIEKKIEVIPETKKLIPVPAVFEDVTETVEVKAPIRVWKTSLNKKALPVNPILIEAIKAQGVNLDSAQAGTCFKEYFQPAKYKIETEDLVVQNERNETVVIPAEFETAEEKVEIIPASKKVVEIPTEYDYVEEKVLVEKAKTVWKKGQNPAQKVSGATGEIMCLVNVPAKYKTIKKLVVKTPAKTLVEEVPPKVITIEVQKLVSQPKLTTNVIPAVHQAVEKKVLDTGASFMWADASVGAEKPWRYTGHKICLVEKPAATTTITKSVLKTPENVNEEIVPATFKVVKVEKLLAEAKEVREPVEAEYKTIEKRQKVADSTMVWQRILCQTNMTKEVIRKIQEALNAKSYHTGKPDGVLGRGTRNALERYQKDNALATGGITYETLNSLGITL